MRTWFESDPDRYNKERDALSLLGIAFTEDIELKKLGVLRLTLNIDAGNTHLDLPPNTPSFPLVVVYPDLFPWFRPEVYAYTLDLPRHQNRIDKNLCLLPRGSEYWLPQTTVAELLHEQLKHVLIKGNVVDAEAIKNDPHEQAEPYSDYYPIDKTSSVLLDPGLIKVTVPEKGLRHIGKIKVGVPRDATFPGRLFVLEISQEDKLISSAPSALEKLTLHNIPGVLLASRHPPPFGDYNTIKEWLEQELTANEKPIQIEEKTVGVKGGSFSSVIGIAFREEHAPGNEGIGWMFIIKGMAPQKNPQGNIILGRKEVPALYLAKPSYVQFSGPQVRVPRLTPLQQKTVAIAGLGALGSFIAVELARSGVARLKLLDFDVVDHPNLVRWPLGLPVTAKKKTDALKEFIEQHFPSSTVEKYEWKIGETPTSGKHSPVDKIREMDRTNTFIANADLVFDATAEDGISHFMSEKCRLQGLPYVSAYATPGAWGGVIMRLVPGSTGCWTCMKMWQTQDQTLVPPKDESGSIQPPGCGDITFTGASFDLQNISLAAVRLAVSTLCSNETGGYEALDWDWAVLRMVDSEKKPTIPTWIAKRLEVHPDCPYCGK